MRPKSEGSLGDHKVDALIDSFSDCTLDPERWDTALTALADLLGANTAILWVYREPAGIVDSVPVRADPEAFATYLEYYCQQDMWMDPFLRTPAGGIAQGPELVDERDFLASEFFNDFLVPADIRDICAIMLLSAPGIRTWIATFRPTGSKEFTSRYVALLRLMRPVLQRAAQARQRLSSTDPLTESLVDAFETLPEGALLVDNDGGIMFANRTARGILRQEDGLACRKGKLVMSNLQNPSPIDAARPAGLLTKQVGHVDGLWSVPRRSGRTPYSVLVVPLARNTAVEVRSGPSMRAAAVVFVRDELEKEHSRRECLKSLFGLTEAEAEVAMDIADGLSVEEIADARMVSKNTVRSQLKAIFYKTDTRRQTQLGRLVESLDSSLLRRDQFPGFSS